MNDIDKEITEAVMAINKDLDDKERERIKIEAGSKKLRDYLPHLNREDKPVICPICKLVNCLCREE